MICLNYKRFKVHFINQQAILFNEQKNLATTVGESEYIAVLSTWLERNLQLFSASNTGVNVKKILLYGDRSYIDQLCSQIKQITGIETLLINPFNRVVNRKKAQGVDNASCYVLATGIATREVQS